MTEEINLIIGIEDGTAYFEQTPPEWSDGLVEYLWNGDTPSDLVEGAYSAIWDEPQLTNYLYLLHFHAWLESDEGGWNDYGWEPPSCWADGTLLKVTRIDASGNEEDVEWRNE